MELYDFQRKALDCTGGKSRCAYYLDMGLGKTFVGSEKAVSFGCDIVVICQKSKVADWVRHFTEYYDYNVMDLTASPSKQARKRVEGAPMVTVVNYDIVWRRTAYFDGMRDYVLMLDESSCIQNETSKRTKYITRAMHPMAVVLLSGTPCNGKYENLWTQCNLLGWDISKGMYWDRYIRWFETDKNGYPVRIVTGYKNVEELKTRLREYGAVFMKSDEVFSLPEQVITDMKVDAPKEYRVFARDSIVSMSDNGPQLVGTTPLTKLLYARQIASAFNPAKYSAFADMLESTNDRLIVFYNFDEELNRLKKICDASARATSEMNGHRKDLNAYEEIENSVVLVQYQSGAMGLNLQYSNKVVFFGPPLSCELYLQAFKRIHRIGQKRTCFYYRIMASGTVEEKIYKTLERREDYTLALFESGT